MERLSKFWTNEYEFWTNRSQLDLAIQEMQMFLLPPAFGATVAEIFALTFT
jgi:hypothetical protein